MICHRCLLRTRGRPSKPHLRTLTTSPPKPAKAISPNAATTLAPRQGTPGSSHQPSSATSTSAAQPFSTPLTPSPAALGIKAPKKGSSPPVVALSSVPAGTPLKGLNFLKGKSDPVAMEDSEYPSWLWTVLKERKEGKENEAEGDLFSKSKKQRRLAAKKLRKQALLNPDSLVPKVPLYEQSVDLPAGDGTPQGALQAQAARDELTKAMRAKRRSSIKEANFLRAMG